MADSAASPCPDYAATSPENADCAWCAKFRLNLDRQGRLCARCAGERSFRKKLEAQAEARFGSCAGAAYCTRFNMAATAEICAQCRADAEYRTLLFSQALARNKAEREQRKQGCSLRGRQLRLEQRTCCGGRRQGVTVYECPRFGEASEASCVDCEIWNETK